MTSWHWSGQSSLPRPFNVNVSCILRNSSWAGFFRWRPIKLFAQKMQLFPKMHSKDYKRNVQAMQHVEVKILLGILKHEFCMCLHLGLNMKIFFKSKSLVLKKSFFIELFQSGIWKWLSFRSEIVWLFIRPYRNILFCEFILMIAADRKFLIKIYVSAKWLKYLNNTKMFCSVFCNERNPLRFSPS